MQDLKVSVEERPTHYQPNNIFVAWKPGKFVGETWPGHGRSLGHPYKINSSKPSNRAGDEPKVPPNDKFGGDGPQGDIGLAHSITSSAVARSESEMVPLFQKKVSFNVPATGGGYQTFGMRLTVASNRVYGWCRPRIPWIKAATLSTFCSIVGCKSVS